jgi:hypothetical protein
MAICMERARFEPWLSFREQQTLPLSRALLSETIARPSATIGEALYMYRRLLDLRAALALDGSNASASSAPAMVLWKAEQIERTRLLDAGRRKGQRGNIYKAAQSTRTQITIAAEYIANRPDATCDSVYDYTTAVAENHRLRRYAKSTFKKQIYAPALRAVLATRTRKVRP